MAEAQRINGKYHRGQGVEVSGCAEWCVCVHACACAYSTELVYVNIFINPPEVGVGSTFMESESAENLRRLVAPEIVDVSQEGRKWGKGRETLLNHFSAVSTYCASSPLLGTGDTALKKTKALSS